MRNWLRIGGYIFLIVKRSSQQSVWAAYHRSTCVINPNHQRPMNMSVPSPAWYCRLDIFVIAMCARSEYGQVREDKTVKFFTFVFGSKSIIIINTTEPSHA